jgi:hypothetical protein
MKFTPSAQLPPGDILSPAQSCIMTKSCQFVPTVPVAEMFKEALPVFETVTLCIELPEPKFTWPNERLVGARLTTGAGVGGELPPPPPQATQIPTTSNAVANNQLTLLPRLKAKLTNVARVKNPHKRHVHPLSGGKLGGNFGCKARIAALALPVVLKVSMAVTGDVPAKLIDEGEIVQVIPTSLGTPQVMLRFPVNP